SDIVSRVAGRCGGSLSLKDCDSIVRIILNALSESLASGGRVEIRGFGSFALNYRAPRIGRNPRNGESVAVPARCVPRFKPGKELRTVVDRSSQTFSRSQSDE
ncbi:HU family DNA-binding protein, partial [Candidatus Ichthyocystis hellenicum]|uniref:HU family DNA-binding protein n=2 Tax=Candidatus Ichthyocystis TaxID=2929841 RepID=UPI000A4A7273